MRSLKEVDCHPRGAKREPYNYVESFDKAAIRHNTILHCEETLADSKYSEFSIGWDLSFPGSMETDEALWSVSYCRKYM